jgi:hypothetical protein
MSSELKDIIQRVLAGSHDETDRQAIAAAIGNKKIVLAPGDGAVGIGGNVKNSQVITGSNNVIGNNNLVFYIKGEDAKTIQAWLYSNAEATI